MDKKPKEYIFLVDAFRSLPSIGEKTANKLAVFFLGQDQKYKNDFLKRIGDAIQNIRQCEYCNGITDKEICNSCSENKLNKSLCVVLNNEDEQRISKSGTYSGYFHILNLDNNLNKIDVSKINLDKINKQIKELNIKEIIIATSFSISGELIAQYLTQKLGDMNIDIYRIGFGIPLNASIDYIDDETIRESLLNKKKIS